ncbi:signal recognition particle 72 kDa subunit [Cavenderia fasciculata]|uniref:Signal recognition particle subunit SRP72 n=1 Tax=Cavenderia fasciculata TaxID=261658 RepID=F4PU62_CACFS|nr:signal recognition particle 72 kDa subunit [Cavenderia fasciculata]EGG20988.1 signal recognition particle 72 kDa subunit [Cavenderia fasciculata]|eukprot:XP_004358838.1 signal recognition particle 72 kDa subunit [Cavenderia fasciculata]
MSKEQQQPLDILFKELDEAIQEQQYKKAIRVCNKVLSQSVNDVEATQCKVLCYMYLGSFQDAVDTINKSGPLKDSFVFEKAYCLYSSAKYTDALKETTSIQSKPNNVLELEAQIYYKLENYEKTIEIYEQLLSQSGYSQSSELITNLCAVYIDAGKFKECQDLLAKHKSIMTKTYELAYNSACLLLSRNDIKAAETQLKLAKKICIDTLTKDGYEQEDIDEELSAIHVQLGYCQQMNGQLESALESYQNVLGKSYGDSASIVAQNNVISVNGRNEQKTKSELLEQLKGVFAESSESKLNSSQKKAVNLNHCILLLHLKKVSQCEELVKSLKTKNKDSANFKEYVEDLDLIVAFLLMREKKWREAEEILKKYKSLKAQLTLAQLHLTEGHPEKTLTVLQSLDSSTKTKPGIIATCFALYEKLGDYEKAISSLDIQINNLESKNNKDEKEIDSFVDLLKLSANLKMKHQKYKDAAETYEKILKVNPNDLFALPSYIIATSHYDPTLSQKYQGKLPIIKLTNSSVDVDKIETLGLSYGKEKKVAPKAVAEVLKSRKARDAAAAAAALTKKKPRFLPKNYDPARAPDPERWLPKWQRAKNKRMAAANKGKNSNTNANLMRGSQGVTTNSSATNQYNVAEKISKAAAAAATSTSTTSTTSTTTNTASAQKVVKKKTKKMPKNKGKGGKNRRRGKNENEQKRELQFKEDGQEYAQVLKMLGNGRIEAQCFDGPKRLCHISGRLRKKEWINCGDIILLQLRDYQEEKADVIMRYTIDEARSLKTLGELPETARINENDTFDDDNNDIPFEFVADDNIDIDAL